MAFPLSRIFRRMMSSNPTSHFITLPNRPIVQENGDTVQGPLKLHYWEWKGHQPTILFCHAASFHSRCYDRIINEALHGFHVIALDFRGHGRSQQHPPPYRFRWFGEDVLQLIETLNLPTDNLIGIGHSVGGYALTLAAAKASRRLFQSLLLLDPVIFRPSLYLNADDTFDLDHIRRRKNQWSSVEEMISRLEKRELFSRWPEDVLRNYCTYALDENYKLSCAPDGEASIYISGIQSDSKIHQLIEKSKFINDIPIHIVRTAIPLTLGDLNASPTDPDLVKLLKKGRDTQMKEGTHLFPMEQPQLAIELVKELIEENRALHSRL
jgi:pimeloyl-ACP methyl ester carboxylesterase